MILKPGCENDLTQTNKLVFAAHFGGSYQEIAPQEYFLALRAQGATSRKRSSQ